MPKNGLGMTEQSPNALPKGSPVRPKQARVALFATLLLSALTTYCDEPFSKLDPATYGRDCTRPSACPEITAKAEYYPRCLLPIDF